MWDGNRRHTAPELDGVCVGPRVRTIVLRGIQEEEEAGERLLSQLGMSEYYGSEGFDHPPCAVGRVCTRTAAAISAGDDGAGA